MQSSVPRVALYPNVSQVVNVAVPGNNTPNVLFLGLLSSVAECQTACLALSGGDGSSAESTAPVGAAKCWSFTYYSGASSSPDANFSRNCFGVTSPRWSPTPGVAGAVSGYVQWPCAADSDCSLNGECSTATGKCECDTAWSGHRCESLNLLPGARRAGYFGQDGGVNTSSWGGVVLQGSDGKWNMWSS
jgi:hypothetical protein